jgi:iron complex outermembrane receptor protein
MLLSQTAVEGQSEPQLADLSLEELMRIQVERVFGASQRLQPVTEAPASVTVITADDIARYGYRTLADILRAVRGLYVSDDRNYSYVGVRGFARSGDYNTRVLLLVNGHRVNDNVYDQAGIGADFGIDPAMFERVEIIRGPASALYGTSAFFAVVNVITRTGASLNGGSFFMEGGTLGTRRGRASFGRRLSNGVDFAVSGTLHESEGETRLYFPSFDAPLTNGGVAENLDGERIGQFLGRVGMKDVTITGAYGLRNKDVPTASFGTVFNEQLASEWTTDRRTLLDAQYDHAFGATRFAGRASFDRYAYAGVYPLPGDDAASPVVINDDGALGTRWGADIRLMRNLPGRQTASIGGEFIHNVHQNQWTTYDSPSLSGFAIDDSSRRIGVYGQDEIKIRPWLLADVGLRYDRYRGVNRMSPRGAVIVTPSEAQSFKYLYGNAFRAPNVHELLYHSMGVANENLRSESIDTHELVWERYTGEWLRTSASTYWYTARGLISLQDDPTSFDGLTFMNTDHARARGLELEAEMRLKNGAQAVTSYTFQHATDQTTAARLSNSPNHMAKLRFSVPTLTNTSTAFELQYLSQRGTLAGEFVEPATVAHVTFTERLGHSIDVVASVRNLFNQRYADPASDEHLQDSIPQDGRTFRVGLQWAILAK